MGVLRTFSKIHGLAGLRVGYAIADPRMVRILRRLQLPFSVNALAEAAAVAALGDESFLTPGPHVEFRGAHPDGYSARRGRYRICAVAR